MVEIVFKYVVPTLSALVAFLYAVYQYNRGQDWKRSEFAAAFLSQLWTDERIRFCCLAIDWSSRRIQPTVNGYDVFVENGLERVIRHDTALFEEAMKTDQEANNFSWPRVYYRDCFDRFFEYLSLANHYIEIGLVKIDDVKPLLYWLKQIDSLKFHEGRDFLKTYYKYYDFVGVDDLVDKICSNKP